MNNRTNQRSCHDVQYDVLLFGDELSDEYQAAAEHVESCASCQDQLAKLAVAEGDLAEVRAMLRRDRSRATSTDFSAVAEEQENFSPAFRAAQFDFLSAPSHPEMLGRLGRYEIEQLIGAGGMGIVFKGFDTELNRPAAIKVLAPHLAHSGPARLRFAREARAAASIVHEHVVAIHDVNSEHVAPYLVMQYVAGQSLQQRVDQQGPLAPEEILRIGMQAAAGLAAAHNQGVIHRDVKPANILLENGMDRALLTDFGLARAADDATLTHSGIVTGTPHYMSPEQARGGPSDARSDLFSLGAVLYFMATGHPPFRAEQAMAILHRICHDRHRPVQQLSPSIPDDLADVIDRLLEKKPGYRFATADEVQQALARALVSLRQPPRFRVRSWLRRLRRRHGNRLAVACLAVVICVAGLALWKTPSPIVQNKADRSFAVETVRTDGDAFLFAESREFDQELQSITQRVGELELPPSFAPFSSNQSPNVGQQMSALQTEISQLESNISTIQPGSFSSGIGSQPLSNEIDAIQNEVGHLEQSLSP